MNDKLKTFFVLLLLISSFLNIYCFFNITRKNSIALGDKYKNDMMMLQLSNNNPEFNYFNGIYMAFVGIMMFCIFCIGIDYYNIKYDEV
jgi:hypothetical protein